MKCAETTDAGQPLRLADRAVPVVQPNGVLVKTAYAGMCHSEIHFIDDCFNLGEGKTFHRRDILGDSFKGIIPGHEISGIVHELGSNVKSDLQVGDSVIVYPWYGCQKCCVCETGECQMCEHNSGTTTDAGQGPNDGGYATHVSIPDAKYVIKLPKSYPLDVAAMLPCSGLVSFTVLTKVRPFVELARRTRGVATVMIIGCGGLGQWVISLARLVLGSAVSITAADISSEKLKIAVEAGADHTILLKDAALEEQKAQVLSVAKGGITACIDIVGIPKTSQLSVAVLHKDGVLALLGFLGGGTLSVALPPIVSRNLTILGNRTGGITKLKELLEVVNKENVWYPPRIYYPLEKVNEALTELRYNRINGRGMLKF